MILLKWTKQFSKIIIKEGDITLHFIWAVIVFCAVLGLTYVTVRMISLQNKKSTVGEVLGVLPLGVGRGLYIVDIAGEKLLLGVTKDNISLIKDLPRDLVLPERPIFGDVLLAEKMKFLKDRVSNLKNKI